MEMNYLSISIFEDLDCSDSIPLLSSMKLKYQHVLPGQMAVQREPMMTPHTLCLLGSHIHVPQHVHEGFHPANKKFARGPHGFSVN